MLHALSTQGFMDVILTSTTDNVNKSNDLSNKHTLTLRNYQPSHYSYLCQWLTARNMEIWAEDCVPEVGFVVCDQETPVAMGFLRLIEGNIGMFDGLCTDPEWPASLRDSALDVLVTQLVDKARSLNMSGIISFTKDKNIVDRGLRFGFKQHTDQVIITLSLKE